MAKDNAPLAIFNRGIIDKRAVARVDVKRVALAAESSVNWMPRTLGSMTLRPGLEFIDSTNGNAEAKHLDFVFSADDTAIVEITDSTMRVRVDEQIVTRVGVSTTISNGLFTSNLTGWTDNDEAGATSQFATGGYLDLAGTRFNRAIRDQQVTVATADIGVKHGLKIIIERGPVLFRCGSSSGAEDFINEQTLGTGQHSLVFTPSSNFHIRFSSRTQYSVLVDSIAIESAGMMTLAAPWRVADLDNLRWYQSGDVIFVACNGFQQIRIERRGDESWSLVKYETEDGPFRGINLTTLTMTAAALTGDTTLTASQDYFKPDHVGSLFRLRSVGQKVSIAVDDENQVSDSIRVTGVGNSRIFDVDITGTWTATVTLERSVDDEASWTDVTTYTSNQNTTHDDGLDNEIVFYRIGVQGGDFTSGTATCTLEFSGGGITGTCRVTKYTSATVVNIAILNHIGQTTSTDAWNEGIWNDVRGFPSAVVIYEGRLWWVGKDFILASVSDAFASFDDEVEGDSGPIIRSVGVGPVDSFNFLLGLQRLVIGTESLELSARSSTQDEPLTPTNFNLKVASSQGSSAIGAVVVDHRGIFVQRGGFRVYLIEFDNLEAFDYTSLDLTILVPDIGDPGIVRIAVQRQPDTRVHFLRADGTVAVLIFNPTEDVKAFVNIETGDADWVNGVIEDVIVLPGFEEDVVYYVVKRVINGVDKRYLEKWALESECIGETYNCQADSFMMFINNPASSTVDAIEHLEGESVVVWADGMCLRDADDEIATFTVSSGSITLTNSGSSYSASQGIVGLPYKGRWKSGVLPAAASLSTPLTQRERISNIALMIENTHNQGLKFGRSFDNMDNLPKNIKGANVDADDVHLDITIPAITFPGDADPETRLYLEANAPRPVTLLAAILGLGTYDRNP